MAPRATGSRPRGCLALLRAGVLLALRFLALPLHARLLVVLATASLGEDPALLDLLVEAAEGALERLVLTHSDFCQSRLTSSGCSSRTPSRARSPPASGRPTVAQRRPGRGPPECNCASGVGQTFLGQLEMPACGGVADVGRERLVPGRCGLAESLAAIHHARVRR